MARKRLECGLFFDLRIRVNFRFASSAFGARVRRLWSKRTKVLIAAGVAVFAAVCVVHVSGEFPVVKKLVDALSLVLDLCDLIK